MVVLESIRQLFRDKQGLKAVSYLIGNLLILPLMFPFGETFFCGYDETTHGSENYDCSRKGLSSQIKPYNIHIIASIPLDVQQCHA